MRPGDGEAAVRSFLVIYSCEIRSNFDGELVTSYFDPGNACRRCGGLSLSGHFLRYGLGGVNVHKTIRRVQEKNCSYGEKSRCCRVY